MTSLLDAINAIDTQPLDTPLRSTYILGFDTETTGTRYGSDAIVSACLVLRNPSTGFDGDVIGYWEINPGIPMDPYASKVNGFTDEYLQAHGREQRAAIKEISHAIVTAQLKNIPLLAYNAPFDIAMLNGDLKRIGMADLTTTINDTDDETFLSGATKELLVIDPLIIDREVSKRKGKHKLIDTTEYYGVQPHGSFHDATADTIAAVDLIEPMSRLFDEVGQLQLKDLMSYQRTSYNAWKKNFNGWLENQGRMPIRGSWL
ncbi:exonuclease domain-containing protein [Alloscardovia venturai]|uniref:Exonuclease domain-containing protein n=1 Tax=Alloscardovia venturai TaxID=1769421 RepID=A0ABW2Y956_9BIFI